MRAAAFASLLAMAGCGLSMRGLGPAGASHEGEEAGTDDAGAIADATSPPLDGAFADGATCTASIPSGWSLVLHEAGRQACPAGYSAHDTVENPAVGASACTCSCSITQQPSCDTGTLQTHYGTGGGSCPMQPLPLGVSGGGCAQLQPGGPTPALVQVDPLTISGGTCTAAAVGDTTQLTMTDSRSCEVPASATTSVCGSAAPSGFEVCIASAGDVACPTGTPFASRTVVQDGVMLVCSACATCKVDGTCQSATATFFRDYLCTNAAGSVAASGLCVTPSWNGNVAGVEYTATASAACTSGGSTASLQPTNTQTLCCR